MLANMPRLAISHAKKILISGVFATGKTTLCKALVTSLARSRLSVTLVGEIPRRCPYALNQQQTASASAWLLSEQMRAETEASIGQSKLVICDRGAPDILSHTLVIESSEGYDLTLRGVVIDLGKTWCRTYDMVFWAMLDPDAPIEKDPFRICDKNYQLRLEESLRTVFNLTGIEPIVLPSEGDRRISFVVDALSKL